MKERLHQTAITVNGKSLTENCANAVCYNSEIIATLEKPFQEAAGIAVGLWESMRKWSDH